MPQSASSAVPRCRMSTEPQRALLTPSASPSVGPPDRPAKRPRFRSTPSSSVSATPSASNEPTSSTDVNSARKASTVRVLNVWAQLEERYNKRLDEDDIVDLHSCAIIKDRGVLKGAARDYHFGHFSQADGDQDCPDAEQDQEDSEQDDDEEDELNTLPPSEASTYDDPPISKKDLLRGVPPLSATTDADDLAEFFEAEKRRRARAGDEDDGDEDEISPEELAALRNAMEEERQKNEASIAEHVEAVLAAHAPRESEPDATPKCASTRLPESDPESEDELAVWTHDESTAVYAVNQPMSEEDDSDIEFESILTRPPPRRPRSPVVLRKPEVVISQKKKRSVSKEASAKPPDDQDPLDDEGVGRPTPVKKDKGKGRSLEPDNQRATAKPKPLEAPPRGKKRKRVPSASIPDDQMSHPPEPKDVTLKYNVSSSDILCRPDSPQSTSGKVFTTPARFETPIAGPSRSASSFTSSTIPQGHSFPSPEYTPVDSEPIAPSSHEYDYNSAPLSSSPLPLSHIHHARHPSQPPPFYPPPHPTTPGPSLPGHAPPPIDPVQSQQAHYLLAQAMHQLSYIMSAMPPYAGYASSPGQPWPPHPAYGASPSHHPSRLHGTRPYHTPSSSLSHSVLPPSSPSVSPPVQEPRARSRGRSKSRGRRVSFKLDDEDNTRGSQHTIHPELYDSQQKAHKQSQDAKQGKGEGNMSEPSDNSLRLDLSDVPPREIYRGRTPGPPDREKIHTSRGRSLNRR